MFVTVIVAVPELVIVNVAVEVTPVITLPNAKLPLSPITGIGTVPVPEAAIVLVPLVESQLMVIVSL